jgi:hypothetical protein
MGGTVRLQGIAFVGTLGGHDLRIARAGSKSRRLRRRVEGRHSTPERVLHGNFRLPCANLLKRERLRKNSRRQSAVQQSEVNAGELVDS